MEEASLCWDAQTVYCKPFGGKSIFDQLTCSQESRGHSIWLCRNI